MKARAVIFVLALGLAACDSTPDVTFADAGITLPDDPLDLPAGAGADAVIANCTACHSPSTMLQQPRMSRDKWQGVVAKMIEVYKAPIDEAAIPEIIDYMVQVQETQAAGE